MFSTQENVNNAYQLHLRKGNKTHIIPVYLNQKEKDSYDAYRKFIQSKADDEQKRKQKEKALIRSFEIQNFGVYNYDRMQKDEDFIRVAASFEFDEPTAYSEVTIFLITKLDGPCIVKFWPEVYDKFAFDPNKENALVAVMPSGKIAKLSPEEFDKLDFVKMKKDKKFTFKLKSEEMELASLEELEKVLN